MILESKDLIPVFLGGLTLLAGFVLLGLRRYSATIRIRLSILAGSLSLLPLVFLSVVGPPLSWRRLLDIAAISPAVVGAMMPLAMIILSRAMTQEKREHGSK